MSITVCISLTGYVLIADVITTSFTTHSVCLQQVPQLVVPLYLVGLPKPSFLKGPSRY